MNKNQWSLTAYAERDISRNIISIREKPHSEEDFHHLLTLKEKFDKEKAIPQPDELLKVLNCRSRKREEETSNLCPCCLEHMGSSKHWCRICGNSTCRKCLVRERVLRDQTRALFCQKCDEQYLKAMDGIKFYNRVEKIERSLSRLIQEQEGIQQLVNLQREKQLSSLKGGIDRQQYGDIASNGALVQHLTEENKILKVKCLELSKKVEFGKNISRDLKKKLHDLKKSQKESFGSLSNHDESRDSFVEPEKDQLNSSMDHRESLITAPDRNQGSPDESDLSFGKKCRCMIY